jgi:hypothetical protein
MDAFMVSWLIAGVIAGLFTHRVLCDGREILVLSAVPVSAWKRG